MRQSATAAARFAGISSRRTCRVAIAAIARSAAIAQTGARDSTIGATAGGTGEDAAEDPAATIGRSSNSRKRRNSQS
jgi:hypothetical protein